MANFNIDGTDYASKPLDGHLQILITKRLAGIFAVIGTSATSLVEALPRGRALALDDIEDIAHALQPVADRISKLRDEDVDFIMDACMRVTQRRSDVGVGWTPVLQNGVFNHEVDGSFVRRIQITWNVLQENFGQISGKLGLGRAVTAKADAVEASPAHA